MSGRFGNVLNPGEIWIKCAALIQKIGLRDDSGHGLAPLGNKALKEVREGKSVSDRTKRKRNESSPPFSSLSDLQAGLTRCPVYRPEISLF